MFEHLFESPRRTPRHLGRRVRRPAASTPASDGPGPARSGWRWGSRHPGPGRSGSALVFPLGSATSWDVGRGGGGCGATVRRDDRGADGERGRGGPRRRSRGSATAGGVHLAGQVVRRAGVLAHWYERRVWWREAAASALLGLRSEAAGSAEARGRFGGRSSRRGRWRPRRLPGGAVRTVPSSPLNGRSGGSRRRPGARARSGSTTSCTTRRPSPSTGLAARRHRRLIGTTTDLSRSHHPLS